jgi:hypothetical protein
MKLPKFHISKIGDNGTSVCPNCGALNKHTTGNDCGHVAKITAKGMVYYYWGFRPLTEEQEVFNR